VLRSVLGYDNNQIATARDGGAFGTGTEAARPSENGQKGRN